MRKFPNGRSVTVCNSVFLSAGEARILGLRINERLPGELKELAGCDRISDADF